MAFKAKLQLADGKYDVLSCDYSFHRDVDLKGRPDTDVYGGAIRLVVESNDDTDIVAQLLNQFKPVSGSVTFHKGVDAATMKELKWENGYIIKYNEMFDVASKEPMKIYFEIAAQKMTMGSETVDQKWPE